MKRERSGWGRERTETHHAVGEITDGPADRLCHAGDCVEDDFAREYQEWMYQPSACSRIHRSTT